MGKKKKVIEKKEGLRGLKNAPNTNFWQHLCLYTRCSKKRIPNFIFGITSVIQHRF